MPIRCDEMWLGSVTCKELTEHKNNPLPQPLDQPPFKVVSRPIMSDARLRRVNKEIAGASDGQFIGRLFLIRHRLQERQVVENQH